ncbi:MAG: BamA/TamA family outer membrane protein [Alistipes putredinis]|nr:MAG: BamA/TamA family outer membrane protein [Alistipes putredinis]
MELRYPIILQPSSTIYGLVFAEAGNAFSSWKEFDPFKVRRAAGVGARLYLPIVGMLGLDWGYGFDKPAGSNKRSVSQFHFSIGYEF